MLAQSQKENEMAEPTSTSSLSLAALAIALLGPAAGPFALIIFAALAGALWPLSAATTMTRKAGAGLLIRCTLMAVVLTGGLAMLLGHYHDLPEHEMLAPLAFAIGALGNGWRPVLESVGKIIQAAAATLAARTGGDK